MIIKITILILYYKKNGLVLDEAKIYNTQHFCLPKYILITPVQAQILSHYIWDTDKLGLIYEW